MIDSSPGSIGPDQSKVAYLENVYGMAGCERNKVINKCFYNFLDTLLPPIMIFQLTLTDSLLSDDLFKRLKKMPEDEYRRVISEEEI